MKLRYKLRNAIIRSLGLDDYINTNMSSLPSQPINVYSTDAAMKLSAAYRCTAILSVRLLLCHFNTNGRKTLFLSRMKRRFYIDSLRVDQIEE